MRELSSSGGDGLGRRHFLRLGTLLLSGAATGCADFWYGSGTAPTAEWSAGPPPRPTGVRYIDSAVANWKASVEKLAWSILPEQVAPPIVARVRNSDVYYRHDDSFHGQFSSPLGLTARCGPTPCIYAGCTFELDQLPYYDTANPCLRSKDLNAVEIAQLTFPAEVRLYGVVLSPCSSRRPPERQDYERFYRTIREVYGRDPQAYRVDYVRNVTDGRGRRTQQVATGATSRDTQRPAKNFFITPADLS